MLSVKLVKIKSNHQNLRTDEVVGKTTHIPEVGEGFTMFAPPLEAGSFRTVFTTEVQECRYDEVARKFNFKTLNSEYDVYVLDAEKNPMDYARVKTSKSRSQSV